MPPPWRYFFNSEAEFQTWLDEQVAAGHVVVVEHTPRPGTVFETVTLGPFVYKGPWTGFPDYTEPTP